ncbi:MAG: thioredoxin [Polaromonas sp.]|nr:thioredoxin [Polaromonas sp.]
MIDVTIANFETEVVAASMTTPVLLDFWAPWCGPCKSLGPILEKLEVEYGGRFKLVKVDSDQEQQLAGAFGIRSIPTCILMVGGQPVDGFTGAQTEGQVKAFLDKNLPPAEEAPAEEEVLEEDLDPGLALARMKAAVENDPDNHGARFDYIRQLMLGGQLDEARAAFAPVVPKVALDRKLAALQIWLTAADQSAGVDAIAAKATHDGKVAANRRDFEARYQYAQALIAAQRWTDAMDELLEILMRDKTWNEELARKTFIAVLDIIEPPKPKVADGQIPPDDPVVATYRRRLSSVILS